MAGIKFSVVLLTGVLSAALCFDPCEKGNHYALDNSGSRSAKYELKPSGYPLCDAYTISPGKFQECILVFWSIGRNHYNINLHAIFPVSSRNVCLRFVIMITWTFTPSLQVSSNVQCW